MVPGRPATASADPHRTIRAFRDAAMAAGVQILEECARSTGWCGARATGSAATSQGRDRGGPRSSTQPALGPIRSRHLAGDPLASRDPNLDDGRYRAHRSSVHAGRRSLGRKLSFKQTAQGTLVIGGGSQGRLAADRQSATVDVVALAASVNAAVRLFPLIQGIRIVRTWAGMEAMTVDHLPVIGLSQIGSKVLFTPLGSPVTDFSLFRLLARVGGLGLRWPHRSSSRRIPRQPRRSRKGGRMIGYVIRRLLLAIPTMLAMLTVVFILVRLVPGDPLSPC